MFEKTVTDNFEKVEDHITNVEFQLSQGEGLLFADDAPFTVQVNVYTIGGTRHTSHELSSSSGVQYLREVLGPEEFKITKQPVDCKVEHIGDTATFDVNASGVYRYQWQYRVNTGEWKECTSGDMDTFEVVATQERINTHTYRCWLLNHDGISIYTDVVKILYTDRSDE